MMFLLLTIMGWDREGGGVAGVTLGEEGRKKEFLISVGDRGRDDREEGVVVVTLTLKDL